MLTMYFRILSTCFICLFIAACDKQEQTTPVKNNAESKTVPQKTKPILDLSIDNISLNHQENNDDAYLNNKKSTEENSNLFKTLSKDQTKSSIDISGKLFTDDEKLENKEYLDSVEGVQINIEGEFELN